MADIHIKTKMDVNLRVQMSPNFYFTFTVYDISEGTDMTVRISEFLDAIKPACEAWEAENKDRPL